MSESCPSDRVLDAVELLPRRWPEVPAAGKVRHACLHLSVCRLLGDFARADAPGNGICRQFGQDLAYTRVRARTGGWL